MLEMRRAFVKAGLYLKDQIDVAAIDCSSSGGGGGGGGASVAAAAAAALNSAPKGGGSGGYVGFTPSHSPLPPSLPFDE